MARGEGTLDPDLVAAWFLDHIIDDDPGCRSYLWVGCGAQGRGVVALMADYYPWLYTLLRWLSSAAPSHSQGRTINLCCLLPCRRSSCNTALLSDVYLDAFCNVLRSDLR